MWVTVGSGSMGEDGALKGCLEDSRADGNYYLLGAKVMGDEVEEKDCEKKRNVKQPKKKRKIYVLLGCQEGSKSDKGWRLAAFVATTDGKFGRDDEQYAEEICKKNGLNLSDFKGSDWSNCAEKRSGL